jgi:hypothetical protein
MTLLRDVKLRRDRIRFLKSRGHLFFAKLAVKADLSPMEQLALKVMEHGGVAFIVPDCEPHLESIVSRGAVFDGRNPVRIHGEPCRCHTNSALYWSDHDDTVQIVTGYALSDDGVWRQHTWCRRLKSGRIVESTEPRVLYFGVCLTHEESDTFYYSQVG